MITTEAHRAQLVSRDAEDLDLVRRDAVNPDMVSRDAVNLDLVSRDAESSERSAIGGGHGFRARTSRRPRRAPLRQAPASRLTGKAKSCATTRYQNAGGGVTKFHRCRFNPSFTGFCST